MNLMKLKDGPGWSPDGGKFWVKGDMLYWHDGEIWDMRQGQVIRTMPGGFEHSENYSEWTDEKREAIRAEWKIKREDYAKQEQADKAKRDALVKSAVAKLSAEECDALAEYWRG